MISNDQNKKKAWTKASIHTSLGWELALPIFSGVFLGYLLDKHFNSHYLLTLIFLIFGIVAGYYSLYRTIELELLRTKAAKLSKNKGDAES
jgi:predicted F0F1-ATPase subunit